MSHRVGGAAAALLRCVGLKERRCQPNKAWASSSTSIGLLNLPGGTTTWCSRSAFRNSPRSSRALNAFRAGEKPSRDEVRPGGQLSGDGVASCGPVDARTC